MTIYYCHAPNDGGYYPWGKDVQRREIMYLVLGLVWVGNSEGAGMVGSHKGREHGFDTNYTCWNLHGEIPSQVDNNTIVSDFNMDENFVKDDTHRDNLDEMLHDAKIVRLLDLKAKNNWSDRSFATLLEPLHEAFPEDNELPVATYHAKKLTCPMGLAVERIHACQNDCILYRKDYKDLHECPVCKASRLKKLYANPKDAKLLRWHAEERKTDGKMRHVADSPQWKNIDRDFKTFGSEIRNIRFGFCSDGINPFKSLSSRHSTSPIILCIYNLPPWLCMKRKYIMMSLLIQGPKQPGNDIDVYLHPLIDDMIDLWETGVEIYDAYKKERFQLFAMIYCTINDFPSYGNLSGYGTKGEKACPICKNGTHSRWLTNCRKTIYMGNRRALHIHHPYHKKENLFDGTSEDRSMPKLMDGYATLSQVADLNITFRKKLKLILNVPSGYSGNIKNLVSMKYLKLLDNHKVVSIFNMIHSKVLDHEKLEELQRDIILILCQLEMYFLPSFFDVMVHLVSHIVKEIKIAGPVFLWYMYPFERYMGFLKGYDPPAQRIRRGINRIQDLPVGESVEFSKFGQVVGKWQFLFGKYVGTRTRRLISILKTNWKDVTKEENNFLWSDIKEEERNDPDKAAKLSLILDLRSSNYCLVRAPRDKGVGCDIGYKKGVEGYVRKKRTSEQRKDNEEIRNEVCQQMKEELKSSDFGLEMRAEHKVELRNEILAEHNLSPKEDDVPSSVELKSSLNLTTNMEETYGCLYVPSSALAGQQVICATATIYLVLGDGMIHFQKLKKGHIKVAVLKVMEKHKYMKLPVPDDELPYLESAVNGFIQWPIFAIGRYKVENEKVANRKRLQDLENDILTKPQSVIDGYNKWMSRADIVEPYSICVNKKVFRQTNEFYFALNAMDIIELLTYTELELGILTLFEMSLYQLKDHSSTNKSEVGFPLVNHQPKDWEYGYYVMKWMHDFVLKYQNDNFPNTVPWNNERPLDTKELNTIIGAWFTLWRH
nr:hypothetical protein [Tanacetum cinerariifolium]